MFSARPRAVRQIREIFNNHSGQIQNFTLQKHAMKAILTQQSYCVPLTVIEYEILRVMEDFHGDNSERYVFYPKTWKFTNCDKVVDWEWNGHFGRNIFFTVNVNEGGRVSNVIRFLRKLLRPNKYVLKGLKDGESGADGDCPKGISELNALLYDAAYDMGRRYGAEGALTKKDEDLE